MPVIALVSPKGGVGKTTIALTLAGAFAHAGESVTLIDADPNAPLVSWAKRGDKPSLIHVLADAGEDTIQSNIQEANETSRLVIVDLEGTANLRVSYAVALADLVIIPCKGSILDAAEAAKAIKLVRRTSKMLNREIDHCVVFSQVPAALQTRNLKDILGQFSAAGVSALPVRVIEREAFRTIFTIGGTLHTLGKNDVTGLENACQNALELAQAVAARLRAARAVRQGGEERSDV